MESMIQRVGAVLQKFPPAHRAANYGRQMQGLARRPYQIRKYLATATDFVGLQIGSGYHHLDGWLKTDIEILDLTTVYMDATNRFPFPSDVFDYIVAEHMIEHITYDRALKMLRECRRVLKKNGVIRISTPDIKLTQQLMDRPLAPELERYVSWSNSTFDGIGSSNSAIHVVNRLQHAWGHQFLYDSDTLSSALKQCGFTEITQCSPSESDHPVLRNVDRHANEVGEEANVLESLIVEAVK